MYVSVLIFYRPDIVPHRDLENLALILRVDFLRVAKIGLFSFYKKLKPINKGFLFNTGDIKKAR